MKALRAQHVKFADRQEESKRIHLRSQEVLKRSYQLVGLIRRQIDREAHRNSGYLLEVCGFCDGVGGTAKERCPARKGNGTVLVHQPALKCPRCNGSGKPEKMRLYFSDVCTVCRGSGWVLTVDNRHAEEADSAETIPPDRE